MNIAIIPAGGGGTRFGGELPKQFTVISGMPLIIHTLLNFSAHPDIDRIIVGVHADYIGHMSELLDEHKMAALVVKGGDTRQSTVYNCLRECGPGNIVLIHDAARPFVTAEIISENIRMAKIRGAVNTVIPATDTVIESKDGLTADKTLARNTLYHVQTPQTFKYEVIMRAHGYARQKGIDNATDDCGLCMDAAPVYLVRGNPRNIKITTPEDLSQGGTCPANPV